MSMHLQREIDRLKKMILALSALVEESVREAVISVERRDSALATRVEQSDSRIDEMEVEVEEECLKILALHQPVAIDLRFIIATLKINNDLERIGDLAVNITERTLFLCEQVPVGVPFDYAEMSRRTLEMLHGSLDALVNMEASRAQAVLAMDDQIDRLHREMYAKIAAAIRANPAQTECLISYLSVSRNLERIADSCTNIAEDVIYLVEGRIARHGRARH